MSSVGRWVLMHAELLSLVHALLFQFQLERLSRLAWFGSLRVLP
jgi:hypothetical protein